MESTKPSLNDLRIDRAQARDSKAAYWIAAAVILLLGCAGGAVWVLKRPRGFEVQTVAAREAAGPASDRPVLNASGFVTARRSATVSSKVTGKVIEVLIEEGLKVKEGQVLARLDDRNVKTALALAEAQLEAARQGLNEIRVRITEAELELKRQVNLLKNNIATQADFERAEAAALALKARLEQQQAQVTVAEREVASWQQNLEDTIIRAPFSGIVTVKNAQPGEMISPVSAGGGFTRTGICTLVDMESLEIEIDVSESYINRVEPGQPVEAALDAYSDWKIPCKVIAIIPTADRQKSTVKVRVGFDQLDPKILPEMSVKVAFRGSVVNPSAGRREVSVPSTSVQKQDGRDIVWVVGNGRVERRAVTISSSGKDEVVVSSGLAAAEKVVLNPPVGIAEGARVVEAR
jgi:HlyD family secretion protein